jgi:serine/threonine protein kinase
MLELNPNQRITAKEALEHPYFGDTHYPQKCLPEELPKIELDSHEYQARQNKQKQQPQINKPQQNFNQNLKNKADMMVGKQYKNPNYYNKVATEKGENKIKFEDSQMISHNSTGSGFVTTSSRLEALINPNSEALLHNKRIFENPLEEEGLTNKKQKMDEAK